MQVKHPRVWDFLTSLGGAKNVRPVKSGSHASRQCEMPGASGVRGGARSGAMSRAGSRARCASTLVMVFVAVAVAPRACAAANAWKAAENKLRQEGLLVDDAGLPDDGESAAAVEAGPAERVSPAEEKFRAARDILSEFTTRHRRNARAVGWLREALALDPNHREAMTLLGRAYQMGEGVEPDEALAMEHFRRAADLGDPGAHFELGFAYSVGWVRPRATRRKSRLPGRKSARKTRVASPNRTLLGLPSEPNPSRSPLRIEPFSVSPPPGPPHRTPTL